MKPTLKTTLSAGALVLAALNETRAQYTPPPPPAPFPGFLNEYMRAKDPYANQWDIGGDNRLRYQANEGYGMPGVGKPGAPAVNTQSLDFRKNNAEVDNEFWLTRTRLHIGYTEKWWSAYGEAQASTANSDLRYAYANSPAVKGTVKKLGYGPESDTIDLHQAYVTVGNHKEFPLSVKAGRQELSYGEERLIGAFGWNNVGRSFDAVKLRWQNAWFGADFFSGFPVIPEDGQFDVDNGKDLLSGVYATSLKIPKTILDIYFLARNTENGAAGFAPNPQFPQPSARDIYTIGGRVKSKPGELDGWDYSVEGAYQFGDYRDPRLVVAGNSPRLTQDAYMFVVQGGYTFTDWWATPRLGVEYSYGSGDSNPKDGTHGTFDNLFPTNHKFYGYMDFASLQNLQDLRGIFQLKPTSRSSVSLEGHGLWLANTHDNFYTVGGTPRGGIATTPA
ncbi:MAG TPA: alginate export family protein, partial [Verrucomicrobiae bacterium]